MEKAKEFLTANSMSVSTVARLVGYEDPLYFSRVFRKATGIAPQKYYHSIACEQTPDWFLAGQEAEKRLPCDRLLK